MSDTLQTIQGWTELSEQTGDTSHLDRVYPAIDRMQQLIEDVLAVAKSGRVLGTLEPVSLAECAQNAWALADTNALEPGEVQGLGEVSESGEQSERKDGTDTTHELVVDTDVVVRANPERLQALFENLFRNAITHGAGDETRSVTVSVETRRDARATPIGFAVEDDGVGIPADERDEIFEVGYTTSSDGTGFGLSIVEPITVAHGWSIDVVTADPHGTRFEVADVDCY
ncbi:multi-sensor signal transduction histidine kinase [Natrialba chahannaoensis JCM 10990]|uniref:histidine kinase n=1 Tax=Natrialba chahannaoensis JCM 10990 TaxID=1227492 RepID=M0ADQ7_9EURY|nr:HAMP domain-containing sensor histidine kinase [Natrialba chahannaoensis]ELY96511.1 multi-sensor signal transduction histidine kinase [Natrialba chahannaoensis JCM 10990]